VQIRALIFKGEDPESPQRTELDLDGLADLEDIRNQPLPRVYLVQDKDLNEIRKFEKLIVDRGIKHKAKGLSKLLLGHTLYPVIEGNFDNARQLGRSIRTLLNNARKKQDLNAFFIGIKKPVFQTILQKSKSHGELENRAMPIEHFPDVTSWMVHELSPVCHVPQDLMDRYIGISSKSMLVRQHIVLAANSDKEVLILGDTGTGKEIVAREIYSRSNRKNKEFQVINCGGISTTLFESELFGHAKGAFTGAIKDKAGLWEKAHGGTLFLDEIGDLHIDSQVKILRALEDGEIKRVGGLETIRVNARVVAATNRDLFAMSQRGEFREDLYHRLHGILIRTHALRNNIEDIPVLVDFFWKNIAKNDYEPLPAEIVDCLKLYSWPGNVRELKKILEKLYGYFGATNLRVDHLKGVFWMEGQEAPWLVKAQKVASGSQQKSIEQASAALNHLKCSQENIRSLEIQFEKIKAGNEKALDITFKFGIYELESLCRQPSLFRDSFPAVWGLLECLNRYKESFHAEIKERKKTELNLCQAFIKAQTALSKAIEDIVDSVV